MAYPHLALRPARNGLVSHYVVAGSKNPTTLVVWSVKILLDISIISLNTLFIAKNFGDHSELSDYGKKKAYEKEVHSALKKGTEASAGQKEPDDPSKMSELTIEWYRKHKDEFTYEAVMEKLKKRSEVPVYQ